MVIDSAFRHSTLISLIAQGQPAVGDAGLRLIHYDYPVHFFFQARVWRMERRLPDPARVREAMDMLRAAERPLIIAGGDVLYSKAEAELLRLAERFGLPVGETMAGKGAILATSVVWTSLL